MNAYEMGRSVEARAMKVLMPYLRRTSYHGQFVLTDKGQLAPELQQQYGDVMRNDRNGNLWAIELKTEESNDYQNFYLETWSNKDFDYRKPGWLYTNHADLFWYYFIEQDELYSINARKLFHWAFTTPSERIRNSPGRLFDFIEKPQGKRIQMNRTFGRCVPIAVIQKEVGFKLFHPLGEQPILAGLNGSEGEPNATA